MCPEDAIVGFVFIVIPFFFLMMYILMARDCCYETAGSQRQEQEEVETMEQEDLHEQVMGIMFPGQQVGIQCVNGVIGSIDRHLTPLPSISAR